jgi:hypothetical protein
LGFALNRLLFCASKGLERQEQAAKLFEEVYAHSPDHPGALHYLIHVYDDPAHAEQGLEAARKQEAEAFAAKVSGNADEAVAKLKEAVAIEDSI